MHAGAAGARGDAAGLTGGNAGGRGGGVAPGAVQSSPWSHTSAAGEVRLLKQLRCRRTVEVNKMLPTVSKVSSTSVALPGADAPRDSGGRLTKEAAAAWCTTFSPIVESLHRSACLKEVVRKKRLGTVGLVQNFCSLAGFGEYFVEASPGEWVPARDDDNAMVVLRKEFIAFMLSCMANGGLARRPDGELVLVGACCGAGFARSWLCRGGCATRSGRACEVRALTPAARRAKPRREARSSIARGRA